MELVELLERGTVVLPLEARDKWEAIRTLTMSLVEAGKLPGERFEEVHRALVEREKELSTGMEKGIAVPHAGVDMPGEALGALGLAPQGIPFECLDGEPARIIFLMVTPKDKKLRHLRTLSTIVRVLAHEGLRRKLLECSSVEEVMRVLQEREEELLKEGGPWPGRRSPSS